jgi:hypothetical protein
MDRRKIDPYGEEQWDDTIWERFKIKLPKIWKITKFFLFLSFIGFVVWGVFKIYSIKPQETRYNNESFVIKDKHLENKTIIIQRLADTTYYAELNEVEDKIKSKMFGDNWDGFYYNHKVGDTLYFDYIRMDRFFQAKNGINK